MEILTLIWTHGAAFLFILTVIVFFHELGHYTLARRSGVRVEVFSIGFGPELFGWNTPSGTRWKVSLLPLGGYVKMFGENVATSRPDFLVSGLCRHEPDPSPRKRGPNNSWLNGTHA